ncbi:MAG: hypothetical protein KC620_09740 [Myxococcales bacterium]|nr:hypothetical protein [Myxococcales bacterium]
MTFLALAVAAGATVRFLLTDAHLLWKATAVLIVVVSTAMQYVPSIAVHVHGLVPLLMQAVLDIVLLMVFKLQGVGGRL